MDDQTIQAIVEELRPELVGRVMGKVFQLMRNAIAIDFRTNDGRYLFINVEPALEPRLYMIARRVRDLEKQSLAPSPFILVIRKHLSGATLLSLTKDENDRIVRFSFAARNEMGDTYQRVLIAQLTGRAANLLLLDDRGYIIDTLRPAQGEGQQIGDFYAPPPAKGSHVSPGKPFIQGQFNSLSAAADNYYLQREAERAFAARAAAARTRLRKELTQRYKLLKNLQNDLAAHGEAEEHKRVGELLLANIGTAERQGNVVRLTDYFAADAPRIELEIDENLTLQQAAARRFARYTKAKRAAEEIARRLNELAAEIGNLEAQQSELENVIALRDEVALENFGAEPQKEGRPKQAREKSSASLPGVRRYRSSDGYEILVGRAARDNDHLTFRLARPHDLWMHAADYPGSHVVVRNPTRAEIPHRTIIEAAQLAAKFSQAREDTKVDVHYTPRKFLSKPKGAAPGLVRMSSFRTLTVEPRESVERI